MGGGAFLYSLFVVLLLFLPSGLCLKTLVPAYIHPRVESGVCVDENWQNLTIGGDAVMAIVNPDNGPVEHGSPYYQTYVPCMLMLHSHHVQMIGYVPTKLDAQTFRSIEDIKHDIYLWATAYPYIAGIFIDMQPTHAVGGATTVSGDFVQYYKDIFAYFKSNWWKGYKIVINPGMPFPTDFLSGDTDSADVVVIYQGDVSQFDPACNAPWCEALLQPGEDGFDQLANDIAEGKYPGKDFAALVYNVTDDAVDATVIKGANANLGYMYVTDQEAYSAQSGQYDNSTQLPSYWQREVQRLDQSCPGSSCIWSGHHVRVIHKRQFHGKFLCSHFQGTCHCTCDVPGEDEEDDTSALTL
jgi:hypothetical protein